MLLMLALAIIVVAPVAYFLFANLRGLKQEDEESSWSDDPDAPLLIATFQVHVVGTAHSNNDGTDRQKIIAKLHVGDEVGLIREPKNPADRNAVRVDTTRGTIGYLSRNDAQVIAAELDDGERYRATIRHIAGGTVDKPSRGVWLKVETGS